MTKRAAYLIPAVAALVLLGACVIKNTQDVQTPVSVVGPQNPTASPIPSAACELGGLQPGTEGDVRQIPPDGTVRIGVSLFGPQGIELASSCLSQYTPVWTTISGPCTFVGSHDGVASAPASATIGATCTGQVDVSGKRATLSLVVGP